MLGLSTFVCACNNSVLLVTLNLLAKLKALISRATALYLILSLFYLIIFLFNRLRLDLSWYLV
ncbi:hypothetical protein B0J11DRAFT_525776 [Dendryphion nanum]|uniref:Uncharacterized protein n=1 Tax=Dendryphion nanum TaxID=256645 RepID=A0A9P9IQ00_9PLEO|nr:hypothetical protein B0J11DRAFT_525776 [Dendryphion nanum]